MKNKFIMLIGIPASGKSSYCERAKEDGWKIVSSDDIRDEKFNGEFSRETNGQVFEIMKQRTIKYLNEGFTVCYDATNVSSKRRKGFLQQLTKINVPKECIFFVADYGNCMLRDMHRTRKVGTAVIKKMYKELQPPMWHEGWDKINFEVIDYSPTIKNEVFDLVNNYVYYIRNILGTHPINQNIDLAQDNPYHTLSISRHMYFAYEYAKSVTDDRNILIASMLHDIGKYFCKEFSPESRYATFYMHENVSSTLALKILLESGLAKNDIIEIYTLINLHMRMHNFEGLPKLRKQIDNELYEKLLILNNADNQAK